MARLCCPQVMTYNGQASDSSTSSISSSKSSKSRRRRSSSSTSSSSSSSSSSSDSSSSHGANYPPSGDDIQRTGVRLRRLHRRRHGGNAGGDGTLQTLILTG